MPFNTSMLIGIGGASGVVNSAVFNSADSPSLSRTYSLVSAPWTFSAWVQRTELTAENLIFGITGGEIHFNADDTLEAEGTSSTALFRDPTDWYHIHVSNNGLYVNGVSHGSVTTVDVGANTAMFSDFNGVVTEVCFTTGTLAVTDFGQFDASTPTFWKWKKPPSCETYLQFQNGANLGENSGTGTDWTANNLTQSVDTPADDYCIWNILDTGTGTISDGGLVITGTTNGRVGTLPMNAGKWAWKITTAASADFGVVQGARGGTESVYSATSGEVLEFQFDVDAGTLDISVDGGAYSSVATGLTTGPYFPWAEGACTADFGQGEFTLDDVTFKYLNTANLLAAEGAPAILDPQDHFESVAYTAP